MVAQILEGTFVAVMLFLVLTHADAFSAVAKSVGSVYTGAVSVLQGRGNG